MGLARIYSGVTGLGQLIITKIGDVGGPPAGRVSEELDAIIAWAKTSPRRIHFSTSTVGTVGTGLDSLHSFSLDTPNRLLVDGDELNVIYGGDFNSNDNQKRLQFSFGGTAYENTTLLDIDGSSGWRMDATIIRLSSSSVRVTSRIGINDLFADSAAALTTFNNSGLHITRSTDITGLTLNGAITMLVQAETDGVTGGGNDDVRQNLSSIYLVQQ